MLIFFSILCGIIASTLLWARIAGRQLMRARLEKWRWGVWVFAGVQLLGFVLLILGRMTSANIPDWSGPLAMIYLWFLVIAPASLVCVVVGEGIRRVWGMIRRSKGASEVGMKDGTGSRPMPGDMADRNEAEEAGRRDDGGMAELGLTRRRFLAISIAALPPVINLSVTGAAMYQLSHFRIRHVTLPMKQLPAGLDGFRIALLADIHTGRFTHGAILDRIVAATQSLQPDLIAFAGDLIDYSLADLPLAMATMKKLSAPYGVHLCEGNHDLFQSRQKFEQGMAGAGLPLLLNEARTINVRGTPLQVMGMKWGDSASARGAAVRENFREMIAQRDPSAFGILLAHHPDAFDPAAAAGIPLTLAGHTHGGQLMLTPHFGAGSLMFKYYSGLYQQGDSSLFVSNGIGNWFPLRVNAPAEIVHLTLRTMG